MLEDILAMRTALAISTVAIVGLLGVTGCAVTVAGVTLVARLVDTVGLVASGSALSAVGATMLAVHVTWP